MVGTDDPGAPRERDEERPAEGSELRRQEREERVEPGTVREEADADVREAEREE